MRERKIFITLALILGAMLLGIVYAAITTQTLNVTGSAAAVASNENFNVVFEGEVGSYKSQTAQDATVTASASGKSGTFSISGLDTKGEYVQLVFPIVNKSPDLGAIIGNYNITSSDKDKKWWDIAVQPGMPNIAANGGTSQLILIVTLKDTPATDTEAPTGNFNVTFDANPT